MILLIDNYDSFTYNLYQQVTMLGHDVKVVAHDAITVQEVARLAPEKIIISPGPRTPDHSGVCLDVIAEFHKTVPILGVCLGHQCIGQLFGSKIIHAPQVVHGKTSLIRHANAGIFKGLPDHLPVARYHSLVVDVIPDGFMRTAWTEDDVIMGMQHQRYPLHGIQFHPESFMTKHGSQLMRNFLNETYSIAQH
jgi:anthranilate synthase/aminodeoxychorismate synthase-like glutamine amidotransferase